ncbi:hypothetical protein J8J40_21095 [Mycobacterium tuberculosis]|nr:hypothetical protein [Mycobacterium tuberculosis]
MTDASPALGTLPATPAAPAPLPHVKRDWLPLVLVPVLALAALPAVGSPTTLVTLLDDPVAADLAVDAVEPVATA